MMRTIKNYLHGMIAFLACLLYGFPARTLKVIGITGTDGKTTTTCLIYHVLKTAGKKVSYISTVFAQIGEKTYDTGLHTTTPDPFMVQKMLRDSVRHGDEYFVLEVTSHALDQHRVDGIPFYIGVLTNITHEHLDYHKTYPRYVEAKAMLLKRSMISIVNHDDKSFSFVKTELYGEQTRLKTYGLIEKSDYMQDIENEFQIPLSTFNRYNFLAAYAAAKEIGVDRAIIVKAFRTFTNPPGRLHIVTTGKITYMIDFAHTPNGIYELLKTIRLKAKRRLIHVFGSAALRDRTKRPMMGEKSAEFADVIILTEEDYRTENPKQIANEIAVGLEQKGFQSIAPEALDKNSRKVYSYIENREAAIEKAIQIAKDDDYCVSTGKGHEKSLCRGTTEYPWDEQIVVTRLLKKYGFLSS